MWRDAGHVVDKLGSWFARAWDDVGKNRSYVLREFGAKMKRIMAKVPFAEDAVALYYCAFDRRTPVRAKAVALAALAYVILPDDFVPDFLPALGFTDDAAAIAMAVRSLAEHVRQEHRDKARRWLQGGGKGDLIDVEYEIIE
ncbi:hypothetical protein GCM10010885_03120 [Alicyclobacillus cellulosilyticus]|uniref:DUF1232 domain-containing protein n=1 Tax=Alicyclobacillus cellulosilyticus TaxID=1003997 RepID=A0A917K3V0_9BACL|nr:YkvA family protein [Alicyclobacillus cellulosilyticus]GGI96863.1 hypothetical protein GCM10010885_03120 [Alicyclobacillus cellulosilyticus]